MSRKQVACQLLRLRRSFTSGTASAQSLARAGENLADVKPYAGPTGNIEVNCSCTISQP